MRTLLFYNGKTGFTKRYSDWIAEELGCEVKPYKDFANTTINADEIIIFGSRVHAGRIEHLEKVKSKLNGKLILFAVGATPASAEKAVNKMWSESLSESEIKSIPHFYMQGGLDYDKMGFLGRIIMKVVANLIGNKKDKSEDETGFAQSIKGSFDISSKEYAMPLVNFVKMKNK